MMVENLGRLGLINPTRFVPDEHRVYGAGYEKVFNAFKTIHDWFLKLPHTEVAFTSLRHIPTFEMVSSHTEPLIQCSDLLAGVVNHLCMLAANNGPVSDADTKLGTITLPALLCRGPQIGWAIWSDPLTRLVGQTCFRSILGEMKKPPADAGELSVSGSLESGPAPVLPPLVSTSREERDGGRRYRFEIPVYGLTSAGNGELLVVENSDRSGAEHSNELDAVIPLFNSSRDAEKFLDFLEVRPAWHVQKFDAREMLDFIERLKAAASHCKTLLFNPESPSRAHMALVPFLNGLERSYDRISRTVTSGLAKSVFKHHDAGGVQVISMLSSDGDYVAGSACGGKVYAGKTREEAVRAFLSSGFFSHRGSIRSKRQGG